MSDSDILSLYTAHQRELVGYANSIVHDNEQAEDIAQDAYLRFRAAIQDEWRYNPLGYLYRIVRNLALDCRRRTRFEGNLFTLSVDDVAEAVPAEKLSPENQAIARDELEKLNDALGELPERTRIAVEMHRLGGYKLREIADRLNISQSMAQYLVKEGVQHCQHRLYSPPSP